ncbi:hypothetical protein BJV78DRAFT_1283272 [Lactifluus subvellereus]|nr:hypothetical protein BJV78DRAFT_1283272 [Lactifluus subvellereus]
MAGYPTAGSLVVPGSQEAQTSTTPAARQSSMLCPKCGKSYVRRQEVERHLMSLHLPDWIGCPDLHCFWRGDRPEEFNKHLSKRHGCNLSNVERNQYEIYDRDNILRHILDQQQSVDVMAGYALNFVGRMALELGKTEWLNDPWGRPGKRARCLNATASATGSLQAA